MIIKQIVIKNFRSYYGENVLDFSEGLTLIIGDNGDGKTTFFEALQWLFNTATENNSIDNASEMRKTELLVGECDEVAVSMLFEHDGEKSVEKRFTFEKKSDTAFSTSKLTFRGYESNGVEREMVNGKTLLDRCFDAFIQRFTMFKGESQLNVFDNPAALKELVDKFSDVRKFDDLVTISAEMENKANTAYLKECKSDKKISAKAKTLEADLIRLDGEIRNKKHEIKEKHQTVNLFSTKLEELEENQETSERYQEIAERLKNLNEREVKLRANLTMVNKNVALLDKLWVLCAFPPVLEAFKQKSSTLSREKRKQDKAFTEQRARQQGKLEALKEIRGMLSDGVTELPWYMPTQETMEEMIHDEYCKVCGRPAPKGSEAYEFMLDKLNRYKENVAAEVKSKEEREKLSNQKLFETEYVEEIHNLNVRLGGNNEKRVSNMIVDINDRLSLEDRWKEQLKEVLAKVQDANEEKARLLIQAGNISEEVLQKDFSDIKSMFEQKGRAEKRLLELESELEDLQEKERALHQEFDELSPQSNSVVIYRDVHRYLNAIAKAFMDAKKSNLRRFLADLEDCANKYLENLSAEDFHGEIRLWQTMDESTEIKLFSTNGTEIKNPSGSQETVMYMSVLFAISDFTYKKRDENYPLIFDAATSSFGDSKEEGFYNVIDKLRKQCIIVTKDFITKGRLRIEEVDKLSCSVYRIKKAADFDSKNMATIRTLVEKIK